MVTFPQLETNITWACQNTCVSCNHVIPLQAPAHLDPAIIERDLSIASKVMHSDWYSLVGGEPTLHPDVLEIIRIVKRSGIADQVVMYSNGQSMVRLSDDFFRELDQLIVTPYKLDKDQRNYIERRCRDAALPLEWHSTNFTRSFYRNPHSPERAAEIFHNCWFETNRRVIDDGYFYHCCLSPFIPKFIQGREKTAEALPLEGITEAKLTEYINHKETPRACFNCGAHYGPQIGWKESPRETWLEDSLG